VLEAIKAEIADWDAEMARREHRLVNDAGVRNRVAEWLRLPPMGAELSDAAMPGPDAQARRDGADGQSAGAQGRRRRGGDPGGGSDADLSPEVFSRPQPDRAFSKLKAHLRKAAEQTIPRLLRRIGRVVTDFSAQECRNFFRHAGYVPT
jgi:hypothetical protein